MPGIAPQQFDNAKTPSLDLQTRTWNQELGAFTRKPTKEHTVSQVRVVQHWAKSLRGLPVHITAFIIELLVLDLLVTRLAEQPATRQIAGQQKLWLPVLTSWAFCKCNPIGPIIYSFNQHFIQYTTNYQQRGRVVVPKRSWWPYLFSPWSYFPHFVLNVHTFCLGKHLGPSLWSQSSGMRCLIIAWKE